MSIIKSEGVIQVAKRRRITRKRRMASDAKDLGIAILAVAHPQAAAIVVAAEKGQKFVRRYLK